ncbi:MAG: FAD-dependent oxidoreductase [Deltaproteobacteria bacterium]|nr:FAD-dependent oxidoreductase [Deltaproteobacteria bacterium]
MKNRYNRAKKTINCDILVIGGGGAGLAAAVAAAEKGGDVIVIEKRPTAGGNAALAGGIFAAESRVQERDGIKAGKDDLFKIALNHAHWMIDPRIVRAVIDRSGDTIQWLEDMGINFQVPLFYPDLPRTAHMAEGHGSGIVKTLVRRCGDLGVQVLYQTAAKRILIGDKRDIKGVPASMEGKEFKIYTKSIIIATGGYAGNRELLKQYYPFYTDGLLPIGLPHMGDGLQMARGAGSATEGLGILHLRGPYFDGAMEVVVAAMQPDTVWLNRRGERFVDEGKAFYWPEAANALNLQPDRISFTLFDDKLRKIFAGKGIMLGYNRFRANARLIDLESKLKEEAAERKVLISESWNRIAEWIGAEPGILMDTIDEYNNSCDQKRDRIFAKNKTFLVPLETPPYYVIKCNQAFFATIGGIKINHRMEVLDHHGRALPGIYAAGNDTGGWESNTYSLSLPGMTFGFAINSGRIAGENAVNSLL